MGRHVGFTELQMDPESDVNFGLSELVPRRLDAIRQHGQFLVVRDWFDIRDVPVFIDSLDDREDDRVRR